MEDADQDAGETDRFGCSPEGACRVILWDQRQGDCQKISKITKSAGAHSVLVQNLSDLRLVQCCAQCCVAVAVAGPIAEARAREDAAYAELFGRGAKG